MRLLYVCGTYAPGARSGSELSAHTLLRELAKRHGVEVLVLTDERYTGGWEEGRHDGVPLRGVRYEERSAGIERAIFEFRPHVLFAQLHWADEALRVGNARGVSTVLRVANAPIALDLRPRSAASPTAIVVASQFMAHHIWSVSGRGVHVVPPCIDLDAVRVGPGATPALTTMFNPIEAKGGDLFHELAAALPDRSFAVVPGWSVLRDASGGWDERLWRRSVAAQGHASWPTPREIDFADLPNVTVLPARDDVREIYAVTRILCVPSRWDEPFGRVAVEAFANGIPVIASEAGGLQEFAGLGGIVIPRSAGVESWVGAVERLDAPDEYRRLADAGRSAARERFGYAATVDPFMKLLRALAPDG